MTAEMRSFVIKALDEMAFPTEDLKDETVLGPEGLGLDSLAFAEVIVQVEEEYDVRFPQDDAPTGGADITFDSFVKKLVEAVSSIKEAETL